jgi:hypothetical protein
MIMSERGNRVLKIIMGMLSMRGSRLKRLHEWDPWVRHKGRRLHWKRERRNRVLTLNLLLEMNLGLSELRNMRH